ncbi:D-threonine aldolase [Acrasis kona]|uniref:D-threonine aldolase n=1 Tax=Acrasis kona TaxID=1008807 RepID=A0AAW2Z2F4_9EUKA
MSRADQLIKSSALSALGLGRFRQADTLPLLKGRKIQDVPTPALILELEDYEHNLATLNKTLYDNGCDQSVKIRGHFKAHKCPQISYQQVTYGNCVGMCCQKVSEAAAIIDSNHQIDDIFISNEIVEQEKIRALVHLSLLHPEGHERKIKISTCVDNVEMVKLFHQTCDEEISSQQEVYNQNGSPLLKLLVEVNVGQNRCGVTSPSRVIEIINEIKSSKYLQYGGIHAYNGKNQHIREYTDRQAAVEKVVDQVKNLVSVLKQHNLEPEIVTGGGTGTYLFEACSSVYNEIQPGSYLFMDVDYSKNKNKIGDFFVTGDNKKDVFRHSLFVLSTVVSRPEGLDLVVVDSGLKALASDSGPAVPKVDGKKIEYAFYGDEHGGLTGEISDLKVGDKVLLIPGHCDPTINMHDYFVCVRGGVVEDVWPITARGPGL